MTSHKRHSRLSSKGSRGRIEQLESRLLLDSDGVFLDAEANLTFSFAPDGTHVADGSNALFSTFDSIAPTEQWQEAILRAFQTWAVETNADIGVVSDNGDPFGIPGNTRQDDRFGDIRIAAIPMSPQIGAISVPIDNVLSGTWYADVIFNSSFNYQSVEDIYAIALHEAGNVFGLEDNSDPNSPLLAGPIPTAITPTADDIANLHDLLGIRAKDQNEFVDDGNNDTISEAYEISFGQTNGRDTGTAPALAYGDIRTTTDSDFYELEIPEGYQGSITVTVRTAGISLLAPEVRLFDSEERIVANDSGLGVQGNTVQLSTNLTEEDESFFIQVKSARNDVYGVGGYSLVAVLDGLNQVSQEEIDTATDGSLRFVATEDLENLFDPEEDFFGDDLGSNDSASQATRLRPLGGFATGTKFKTNGSISLPTDLDFYSIRTPTNSTLDIAYVSVRTTEEGGLIPDAQVLNTNHEILESRVLVNGGGQLLLEIQGVQSQSDLLVRVGANDPNGPFSTGNYKLSVSFKSTPADLQNFASGVVTNGLTTNEHTLYIAEPKLIHFALEVDSTNSEHTSALLLEIYNDRGERVHRIASPPGETRSAGAVYLPIGEYTVRLRSLGLYEPPPELSYNIIGSVFTDPFVGQGVDPTNHPFTCSDPELAGFFCYPGGIVSGDPFLWDDFTSTVDPPPPELPIAELTQLLIGDWWSWFWNSTPGNGPPLAVDDAFSISGLANSAILALAAAPDNVLTNDVDPEGSSLVAILRDTPTVGSLELHSDGTFEYLPENGFSGIVTFTYVAYDFQSESAPATVTLNVSSPISNTPLAGDFNRDGVANNLDYNFWFDHFGATSGIGLQADGNGDGLVNAIDFTIWRNSLAPPADPQPQISLAQVPQKETAQPTLADSTQQSIVESVQLSVKTIGLDIGTENNRTILAAFAANSGIQQASVFTTRLSSGHNYSDSKAEALVDLLLFERKVSQPQISSSDWDLAYGEISEEQEDLDELLAEDQSNDPEETQDAEESTETDAVVEEKN